MRIEDCCVILGRAVFFYKWQCSWSDWYNFESCAAVCWREGTTDDQVNTYCCMCYFTYWIIVRWYRQLWQIMGSFSSEVKLKKNWWHWFGCWL